LEDLIKIKGVKTHNLKNVSLNIKKNNLITISGVSGSGKSSLAFNTLFAEGQRRYIESLSSYARQFLGKLKKPDVKKIEGICPAIAIEQKKSTNSPRSTIATSTEIYDYIKLLFSKIGKTISPVSNNEVKKDSIEDIKNFILNKNVDALILFNYTDSNIKNKNELIKRGFSRLLYHNKIIKIKDLDFDNDKVDINFLYVIVDRIIINNIENSRLQDSIEMSYANANNSCSVKINETIYDFSKKLEMDGITFTETNTNLFSFNNPYGACEMCQGFGSILDIDPKKVIPDEKLSLYEGVVKCWSGEKLSKWKEKFIQNSIDFDFPIHRPYKKLSENEKNILWNGKDKCKGIFTFFKSLEKDKYKIQNRVLIARYRGKTTCKSCNGSRLRKEALYVKVNDKNIAEITKMTIENALKFFKNLTLSDHELAISKRILKEINDRLSYLVEIGLEYLTLDRKSNTLSGGESQRANIAKSISSSLVGSMYILDEPSIGLHSRDTKNLIKILKQLRDIGNTVIVVEHDEEIINQSDVIIDIGPNAGKYGGEIIYNGSPKNINKKTKGLTSNYLTNVLNIPIPKSRKNLTKKLNIFGINKHNLQNIDVEIPLNGLVLITGVSGSGKSTLVSEVIKPAIENQINNKISRNIVYKKISFNKNDILDVEFINQKPIGRSSRSNPVTYTKVYDDIRNLFTKLPLSKKRNYKPGFFSFNIDGGRCPNCKGEGEIKIEMQFMADVYIKCEDCHGKRFKEEVLDIKFFGKNIYEILNLSIDEAITFFKKNGENKIANKLQPLIDVGLKYLTLGQSSNTLSGGEAQRIKLASFLTKSLNNQNTLFIFDEPTTGLHFHDISKLLKSFNHLIDNGNSIICIEHNLDVIKCADWVIDLGPEGGEKGGEITFTGTPEDLINCKTSITGKYLKTKI
tara:strand:- start:27183 stop:29921 length:2739 start_codon:yes stop_codon:yes gene_type:complete